MKGRGVGGRRLGAGGEGGSAVIMALVLIILLLGLSGVAFSLFRFSREKGVRPFQTSAATGVADSGIQQAIKALQKKAAEEAVSDPAMAFFFWGGDINGDGIFARDGEIDRNRNGIFDVSPVTVKDALGRQRPTLEDLNGNHTRDFQNGSLEDLLGNPSGSDEDAGCDGRIDFNEGGYDPILNPDPERDNYHPVFNRTGTEGNGRFDLAADCPGLPGETDLNSNGRLDTVEDGSRWIRWGRKNSNVSKVNRGEGEATLDSRNYLKVVEVNSLIDLNGPEHLAARLLNNLFRTITLLVVDTVSNQIGAQTLGQNSRGLEYRADLDGTIGTVDFSAPPAPTDPHAVQLIKERNKLPGGRFATKDQLFEAIKKLALLTLNDADEWLRLQEFITVHAIADVTVVRQDPINPTGPPVRDPRPPVNVNTAPKEVLQAAIMAGFDFPSLPGADHAAKAQNAFDVAESLASIIFQYRLNQADAVLTGQGAFKSWSQFETFMGQVAGNVNTLIPAGVPNDVNRRAILLANRDRLIAQANPNSRLQRFNPDTTTVRPVDKSQIPYPTAEFTFSGDGLFEITSLGLLSAGETRLPPFMAPTEPNRVLSRGGGEIARSETVSVVKVFEVLKHTTQEEFEGDKPLFQKTRFSGKSYPENMSSAAFSIIPVASPFPIALPSAGALAVDEKSGLVYVIEGATGVRVINPPIGPVGLISVPSPSALAAAPARPGTTLGRLYVAQNGVAAIKVFDINGSVDMPSSTAIPDIAGLSGPPIKLIHDRAGRDLLFSLGTPATNDIGKYAFRDQPPPVVIETDTAITTPPIDIAFDPRLDQLFAAGNDGVNNLLLRVRDSVNGALESFPLFNFGTVFTPRFVETDQENGALFVVSPEGTNLRLRKYSTKGDTTAELDNLVLADLNIVVSDGRLAVDAAEHLIFVVGSNQLVLVSDRGERLEEIATVTLPSAGPYHIALDRSRKRLFISSPTDVSAYVYSLSLTTSFLKMDGQVRLIPNAPPVSSDPTKILAQSNFDSDRDLMRREGSTVPPGAVAKPTGTIVGSLLPDGVLFTSSASPGPPAPVLADLFSYNPTQLYGNGLDGTGPNAEDPGLRRGAMEFWVKLPRLSGMNPTDPPEKVILYRSFQKARVDPYLFIRKSALHTDQEELQALLGLPVDPGSPITFSQAPADYFIHTQLFLDGFQDVVGLDGVVDQANLHLIRYADIPPGLTVSYTSGGAPQAAVPFDPVESNQIDSPAVPISIAGGEWFHPAFSWRIDTNPMAPGNNKEKVQQALFVNGSLQLAGTSGKIVLDAAARPEPVINGVDDDLDGAIDEQLGDPSGKADPETDRANLLDDDLDGFVDDGFSQGPSFLRFGAIIFDPTPPTANIQATIDDLVFYKDETALPVASFTPIRFAARGESFSENPTQPINGLFDPGEPFQDSDLNGVRDPLGDSFTAANDINKNGIWDVGESFTDSNTNNRYDRQGEAFFYNCPSPNYEDYNQNGQCDSGELYWDRNQNRGRDAGDGFADLNDFNRNRIYDGNGYFANTFTATIPAGSRIGTLAWTESRPAGTAINVELVLRVADGRILWQWFSDNISGEGIPLNLLVPEEARLEYRVNLLIQDTARASAVLDDLTVTVISNPQVLYSQEASRPFQFDPSLGRVN